MTAGHEAVKAALVAKLLEGAPARAGKPLWVAAGDVLPEPDDKWPFVLVQTTRMSRKTELESGAPGEIIAEYECEVTVGERSPLGDRASALDDAGVLRDRLLLVVRHELHWSPGLVPGVMRISASPFTEETAPPVLDTKGRAIAIGSVRFNVTALETTPPPPGSPAAPPVTAADVTVHADDIATDPIRTGGASS